MKDEDKENILPLGLKGSYPCKRVQSFVTQTLRRKTLDFPDRDPAVMPPAASRGFAN